MKNSFILLFLFLVIFSNCKKNEPSVTTSSQPMTYQEMVDLAVSQGYPISQIGLKRTWDEVLAKASIYGLKDKLKDKEREENGLMFMSEENLDAHFKRQQKNHETWLQREIYLEKGQKVQSLSEYFNLLDSLPLYRIQRYKSDEEYAALKREYFSSNYQFFINEAVQPGGPNHIPPFLIVVTKPEEMPTEKARRIAKR